MPVKQSVLPLPLQYPIPLPVSSLAVSLTSPIVVNGISLGTFQTGYERSKPNNRGHHSWRRYYRGGWHLSYPPLILQAVWTWQKLPDNIRKHSESLHHACAQCESFATAASRRTWILVSESISRLPLSRPIPIIGLSGHYPNNNLIRRSPILSSTKDHSRHPCLSGVIPSFPGLCLS